VGVIVEYTSGCGYRAEVYEGAGFVVVKELRHCQACHELVGVSVRLQSRPARTSPGPTVALNVCPRCGSADLAQPRRIGARRRPACPKCGDAVARAGAGNWD
jgi:hypothetical protein